VPGSLLSLIDVGREAAAVGNVVLAARHYLAALARASRLEQRLLHSELHALVEAHGPAMTAAERTLITAWLTDTAQGLLADQRTALAHQLTRSSPAAPPPPAGRVNVLFVSSRLMAGQPFGLVQPVDILIEPGGERVILEHAADDEAVFAGFQQAVWAAQQLLLARGDLPSARERFPVGVTVRGVVPYIPRALPVTGPSIGLGAAVGVVSQILDRPVPASMAFTGRVDPKGQLHPVGGVAAKIEAAADKGIRTIFVPAANAADVPAELAARLEVIPSAELSSVITAVFGVTPSLGQPRVLRLVGPGPARTRWLFTCVGKADPWGQYLDRDRHGVSRQVQEEGPILTLCRVLEPAGVTLIHTVSGPDNDYRDKAEAVARFLTAADPGRQVALVPLPAVADPTHYGELVPAMSEAVRAAIESVAQPDTEFFANLSSGSPQMETSWHLLRIAGRLPLRLLQVREDRFTPADESRVREVELPPIAR
jgi:Lon protease (S16) C-terminal proteolytic domain